MQVRSSNTLAGTISTLLVDDEELAREELAFLLRDFGDVEIIDSATNGLEAVKMIESLEPDLVFLDAQMPGLDGLGVIRKLKEKKVALPYFVLSTAYDQYAIEAFRLEAMDYLLKPVDHERLSQTIDRARRVIGMRQTIEAKALEAANAVAAAVPKPALQRTKLLVRSNNRNLILDAQEMIYATIEDGIITIVATNCEGHSNYRTIEELQSNLDSGTFWRVHRSFLVNINRIREVIPWFKSSFQLRMDDKKQTEIPVSRIQTKRLRAMLKL
jgi:two-component system LytT family response regulator/two-component system response regulator LytT